VTRGRRWSDRPEDVLPDARDGLNRLERCILVTLRELQAERAASAGYDGPVPTAMLYGRVVSRLDVGLDEFQATLQKLIGRGAAQL
jgi:hypothetical protein